jgi:hypothetical protein
MAGLPYSPEEDAAILRIYNQYKGKAGKGGWLGIASKEIGRQRNSITNRFSMLRAKHAAELTETSHAAFANRPLSLKDVIRLWDIDTDIWEAISITPRKWDIGAKHPETGEILVKPLYATMVVFKRKKSASVEIAAKNAYADIAKDAQRRNRTTKPAKLSGGGEPCALEVDLMDVHINKLGWAQESGENYDSDIARERARAAVSDLIDGADGYRVEKVILPLGNDLSNIDNLIKQTTGGTPQDSDTRYHRMFRTARGLTSWMIHECAKIAPVEVVIVPGNHDELTAWTLGQVLEAEYTGDKRVTFQSGPMLRKYVRYGKNLIGFTHGCDEPHKNLPQIMAVEAKQHWAETTYREWHVGHLHKQKATMPVIIDDDIGVTVRIIRALSGTDAWHFRKGYVGGVKGAEAFLWLKSGGLRAHLYHTAAA